jgi:hypothetical protein
MATGYPQILAVPALYRIVRTLPVTQFTTVFNLRAADIPADMLAEVRALYPSATATQILAAAIIKQVDVQNTGYDIEGASATTPVTYFEHKNTSPTPGPLVSGGATTLQSGVGASYPSASTRRMTTFYLQASGAPEVAQAVNAIIWFDVPGFGS